MLSGTILPSSIKLSSISQKLSTVVSDNASDQALASSSGLCY